MNILAAWCLKFTRFSNGEIDPINPDRLKLFYNEMEAFYIMVHILENLDYQSVFNIEFTTMNETLDMFEEWFYGSFPDLCNRLFNECGC
jgi:hypothetical protein